MLQNVISKCRSKVPVGIFVFVCGLFVLTSLVSHREVNAQGNSYSTLAAYLTKLHADNIQFYIAFASPVLGDVGWDIPSDIEVDGQVKGHRTIKEIGQDYICIDDWGEGNTFTYCIPFANISSIQHQPAPRPH
jgi:hypothetical protein